MPTRGQKIIPHLWFEDRAEEAASLYASLVPGSRVESVARYGSAGFEVHGRPAGSVMSVSLVLGGLRTIAINGGPHLRPTPAVSYLVAFADVQALDRAWEALADGGRVRMPLGAYPWSARYGWLDDRWGMSWQLRLSAPGDDGETTVEPALMFTGPPGEAEAAIDHYVAVFPDARADILARHDGSGPDPEGALNYARLRIAGQELGVVGSSAVHDFTFSEANAFVVACDDQAEIDRYWSALSAVPEAERCGWLKDRFGVSWIVGPRHLPELLASPKPEVTEAFLRMGKIDVAALERMAR